jgi:hypothetical protein
MAEVRETLLTNGVHLRALALEILFEMADSLSPGIRRPLMGTLLL